MEPSKRLGRPFSHGSSEKASSREKSPTSLPIRPEPISISIRRDGRDGASVSPQRARSSERARSGSNDGTQSARGSPHSKMNRSSRGSPKSRSSSRASSKSPQRFSEDDFDHKRHTVSDSERRKRAVAKVRGLKLDPKDWSRTDLLEKLVRFAKFNQDKKTSIAEVIVNEGVRIAAEDVTVLCELTRRTTEIQRIIIRRCAMTDDQARLLIPILRSLRHLRELDLSDNMLGSLTVELLITTLSRQIRKLQSLDMRDNPNISYDDGERLAVAFTAIDSLNGISFEEIRSKDTLSTLDLSNHDIKLCEVGIVCALVKQSNQLGHLILNRNSIPPRGVELLLEIIKTKPTIRSLDLSYNPITADGKDLTALDTIQRYLQRDKQLLYCHLEGVPMSAISAERISRALQVNRSVESKLDGYYFNKFATQLIKDKAKSSKKYEDLAAWTPKVDSVDEGFVRLNRLPWPEVATMEEKGFSITWQKPGREDSFGYEYGA